METSLLLHFVFLCAHNEFLLYVVAIPTSSTKNPLYIKYGESLNLTCEVVQDAAAVTWIRNRFTVLQITNTTTCSFRKLSSLDTYNYSVTCDQEKRFSMVKYGVNRNDDNTLWNCHVYALNYTDLGTSSVIGVYIYKFPSTLSIVGNDIGILYDGDNVTLSVITGCINPSDSAHYTVTWKYVEASKTAENNFDEKTIMQNVSSIGGCTNMYEGNLKFNLIVTNKMNKGNTSLNISQVKMTFTMAGIDFIATKNVSYTLNPKDATTSTFARTFVTTFARTFVTTSTFARTFVTTYAATFVTTYNVMSRPGASSTLTSSQSTIANASSKLTSSQSTIANASSKSTSSQSTIPNASSTSTSINPTATIKSPTGNNVLKNTASDADINVIVPVVVVPCGLVIIGAIILLVVWCLRRRTRKHGLESPDSNKKDEWKQTGHTNTIDNHNAVYTSPDGFIIYPGPAARSTARSYKDKKSHGGTDQYSRPDLWTYYHQADYTPNTYTSAYTHKGKDPVTDQNSRPYTAAYGHQTAYLPSIHKSARTYEQKAKSYDNERHQQASHPMATSRLAFRHDTIGEIHTTQDIAFYY